MTTLADIIQQVSDIFGRADAMCAALSVRGCDPAKSDIWPLPGLPGIVPLWADDAWTFGMMAVPDCGAEYWPGVMVWRDQAITLASDATTLLPRFLVERHLSNFPDRADALARNWSSIETDLRALHRVLGGGDGSLSAVGDVTLNADARRAFAFSSSSQPTFEAAHEALFRAIDRSPAFAAFADWFSARLRGANIAPEPERFANWARQSLAWHLQFDVASGALGDAFEPLAPLVTQHAGWDTAVATQPGWHDPASGGSLGLVTMAAKLIETGPMPTDRVDGLLIRAVAQAGTGYDGIAHAEAAAVLAEQGEIERAWGALCAAAWWMHNNRGEMPRAILDGMNLIASHCDTPDLLWFVDQVGRADDDP